MLLNAAVRHVPHWPSKLQATATKQNVMFVCAVHLRLFPLETFPQLDILNLRLVELLFVCSVWTCCKQTPFNCTGEIALPHGAWLPAINCYARDVFLKFAKAFLSSVWSCWQNSCMLTLLQKPLATAESSVFSWVHIECWEKGDSH